MILKEDNENSNKKNNNVEMLKKFLEEKYRLHTKVINLANKVKEQEKQLKHMADEASVELEDSGKGKRSNREFSYSKKEELQKPPKRSKLNPSQPFQRVLALPRSVKLKLSFKKNLKFEFYPSNKEGHNLYQHFKKKCNF